MSERRLSRGRLVLFTALLTAGLLWGLNTLVEGLEDEGVVQTHRPDDNVLFVQSELFAVDHEPHYVTSDYAADSMMRQRFAVDKGERFRVLISGGSFAMGTPYAQQAFGAELGGGMPSWLRLELGQRWPEQDIEVVNLAAGGQTSFRVRRIVEETLKLEPDAYFVATCNNEGAPAPSRIQEELHRLGGYRLLTKFLKPGVDRAERSYYSPQDADAARLAKEFRQNIHAIIEAAEVREVPLFLATLPVNLRWEGPELNRPGAPEEQPCIRAMRVDYNVGRFEEAVAGSETCEPVTEALLWRGLSLAELGDLDGAMRALEQSVELLPRNRCRPSFNAIIREEAGKSANTTLVDLDAAAKKISPLSLPGDELFHDYCHMTWLGYAEMSREVTRALLSTGVTPPGESQDVTLDLELEARRMGLGRLLFVGD